MDGYSRGGHSKYGMKVHIIFVTKYRKKLFMSSKRADDVKQFLYDVAKKVWVYRYPDENGQRPCAHTSGIQPEGICVRYCQTA